MSRDELIHMLSKMEKELKKLRFQVNNCNCEYECVNCSFEGCNAMALLHGKYDDEYENCTKMLKCKCNAYFCDQHILCRACKVCVKCSKHEKCKYCDFEICPKNKNLQLPPDLKKDKPGKCECENELSKSTIYHCTNCLDKDKIDDYDYSHSKMYFSCEKCGVNGVNYSRNYYICVSCDHKNKNAVIPPCDSCGLKRHFGCKDFDLCDCGESLCPECVQNCKTCGSLLCTYCNKNSECSKCDEN